MIVYKGQQYTVNIDNHTVLTTAENTNWDFATKEINAVTIQNAGNVVVYLNDDWYFPPGSVIQLGSQDDLSRYIGKVKIQFTETVIELDPANPTGAVPLIQAWAVNAKLCKCNLC